MVKNKTKMPQKEVNLLLRKAALKPEVKRRRSVAQNIRYGRQEERDRIADSLRHYYKLNLSPMKGKTHSLKTRQHWSKIRKGKRYNKENSSWETISLKQYKNVYQTSEYKHWRKAVFEQNNYICQKCGQIGKQLTAHHIYNFSKYQELRFVVKNGITFCIKCHRRFHRLYGTYYNTPEQVLEFMENK